MNLTRMDWIRTPGLMVAAALLAAGTAAAQNVTGAGASFPAPVYAKWADAYHKATGARINYQSVGRVNQPRAENDAMTMG